MRYYSTQRPVSIGTYPNKSDVTEIVNYDELRYIDAIKRRAYGHIEYANELTDDEQRHYDLYPAIRRDEKLDTIIRALIRYECNETRFERIWNKAKNYGYTDEQLATAYDKAHAA